MQKECNSDTDNESNVNPKDYQILKQKKDHLLPALIV